MFCLVHPRESVSLAQPPLNRVHVLPWHNIRSALTRHIVIGTLALEKSQRFPAPTSTPHARHGFLQAFVFPGPNSACIVRQGRHGYLRRAGHVRRPRGHNPQHTITDCRERHTAALCAHRDAHAPLAVAPSVPTRLPVHADPWRMTRTGRANALHAARLAARDPRRETLQPARIRRVPEGNEDECAQHVEERNDVGTFRLPVGGSAPAPSLSLVSF